MNIIRGSDPRDFLEYRDGSGGTVEIFEIVVRSKRRTGIGRALVQSLVDTVQGHTHLIFALMRSSNLIAHDFYQGLGMQVIARLPSFYVEEDAVMYGKHIPLRINPENTTATTKENP